MIGRADFVFEQEPWGVGGGGGCECSKQRGQIVAHGIEPVDYSPSQDLYDCCVAVTGSVPCWHDLQAEKRA